MKYHNNLKFLILVIVFSLNINISHALDEKPAYLQLKETFASGAKEAAVSQAIDYLNKNPEDNDVRLTLAQFYFNLEKYDEARKTLLMILAKAPAYTDARIILINIDLLSKRYEEALSVAEAGLLFDALNPVLKKKREDILLLQVNESSTLITPIVPYYVQLKALYKQGKHTQAIRDANTYLVEHPNDGDVRLVLAEFYFNQKIYDAAREELLDVLSQTPAYKDALLILINTDLMLKRYSEAAAMADLGQIYYPLDPDFFKKQQDIKNTQTHPQTRPKYIASRAPKPAELVKTEMPKKEYLNEVGLYQQNYYISDVKKVWDYSTVYYGREGKLGRIYGKINYNNRLGYQAIQGEMEGYAKFNKYVSVLFLAAYANQPVLFPDHTYGGELLLTIPQFAEVSGGGKYNYVDVRHQYSTFTGSAAKQMKEHRFSYRATFFDPSVGVRSFLNLMDYRHYLREPYLFWGVVYAVGSSPDLANLTTVNFLVTQNQILSPYINFALLQERLIVNLSFYYQHQVFEEIPLVRNWTGGTVRLAWKF